jgi:hypothetical protein
VELQEEPIEMDRKVNWVQVTKENKTALAEKKKKKKQKERKEGAAAKRMLLKRAKVDAADAEEQDKLKKVVEQAKSKAVRKGKVTSVKRAGAKKGWFCFVWFTTFVPVLYMSLLWNRKDSKSNQTFTIFAGGSSRKGKLVGDGTKARKVVGTKAPKAPKVGQAKSAKAALVPKRKEDLVGGMTPGSTVVKEDSKRDRKVQEKHAGACHHGSLLDLKAMNGAVLACYLRPGEYMNGMDCEECSKSAKDLKGKDKLGSMLYYCDKSLIAWQLPDGDDGKEGEICNLVLCPGCFVTRSEGVGGKRQRVRRV